MTDVVTDPDVTDTLTTVFSEKATKTTVCMFKRVHMHHKLYPDVQSYKHSKQLHLRVQTGCDIDIVPQRQIDTLYWVGQKVHSGFHDSFFWEKPERTFPSAQSLCGIHTTAPHLNWRYRWLHVPYMHAERRAWQHLPMAL